jgi:hypothetical protein
MDLTRQRFACPTMLGGRIENRCCNRIHRHAT